MIGNIRLVMKRQHGNGNVDICQGWNFSSVRFNDISAISFHTHELYRAHFNFTEATFVTNILCGTSDMTSYYFEEQVVLHSWWVIKE